MDMVQERAVDTGDPLVLLETALIGAAETGQAADALVEYPGAPRAFLTLLGVVPQAEALRSDIRRFLRTSLAE